MKTVIISILFLLGILNLTFLQSQTNKMVVDGSIQIGHSSDSMANPGSIRWSGMDFEGWDGKDWISLTGGHHPPITDTEGNTYRVVTIGDQIWMAENLRTTKYRGGTAIPKEPSTSQWPDLTTPAFCWPRNDSSQYASVYGALYNWYATEGDSLCPIGWHVPLESEWDQLATFLGGMNIAGEKLKQKGTTFWLGPNVASNASGFTGLPAGHRDEELGNFAYVRINGNFWTATETSTTDAVSRVLHYSVAQLLDNGSILPSKQNGFSIRCVKD